MRGRLLLQLQRSRRSVVVLALGIAVAVVSAAVLLGSLSGGSPLTGRTTIRVAVDDAKSVAPGKNEVRWVGVVVGRITAADLEGERAVLTAEVETGKAPPLFRDAQLRLRPQTALNDMVLDVVRRGTPAAGRLEDGQVLDAGRTQTPVDVAEVLNVFSTDVRDRLERALDELAVGLPDGGAQLRSAFAELVPFVRAADRVSTAIARRDAATRRLVTRVRAITDELARRDGAVTRLVRDAGSTFRTLGDRRADLDRTLGTLPETLDQVRSSFARLDGTLGDVRPALTALRPVAAALPSGLGALQGLAGDLDPALRALGPAVPALRPLARDLAPTSSSLRTAFSRLEPQLPRVDRLTQQLSRCEREVQAFFAWSMSVFKFGTRSTGGTSPRGALVFSPEDFTNGNGPTMRPARSCADGSPTP
ncbi:MlaD family protein [Conexibacter sp. SYSU D00693]|uniref:MlaD family protein n=1 Tax=Conexibacter sp. SYSU D00693 TaxID=2812560 RepID=UPI00196B05DE|nr:MlaD family protein [Conexibacter sp. SYSU D00693]